MTRTKITSPQLNPKQSVDANGWTVFDYGTWKEYLVHPSPAYSGGGTLAADQTGGPLGEVSGISLPVGITNLSQITDFFWSATVDSDTNQSLITRVTGNPYSGTALPSFYVHNTAPASTTIQNVRITIVIRK